MRDESGSENDDKERTQWLQTCCCHKRDLIKFTHQI